MQREQNWDGSLQSYKELLDNNLNEMSEIQASVVYYNMSTSAFEKGDLLKAYIWSKKSLALNPKNELAQQAFAQYSKKVEIPVISHQTTNLDYAKSVVSKLSLDVWVLFSLILIFSSLWFLIKNILNSKKNRLANDFSVVKKWPAVSALLATLLVLSITYIRFQDHFTVRALVVAEKAQIQTAPGDNKPVIFELQAGQELEVLKSDDEYFQVRYPGAFSGWIKKVQVELLSLTFEQ